MNAFLFANTQSHFPQVLCDVLAIFPVKVHSKKEGILLNHVEYGDYVCMYGEFLESL